MASSETTDPERARPMSRQKGQRFPVLPGLGYDRCHLRRCGTLSANAGDTPGAGLTGLKYVSLTIDMGMGLPGSLSARLAGRESRNMAAQVGPTARLGLTAARSVRMPRRGRDGGIIATRRAPGAGA